MCVTKALNFLPSSHLCVYAVLLYAAQAIRPNTRLKSQDFQMQLACHWEECSQRCAGAAAKSPGLLPFGQKRAELLRRHTMTPPLEHHLAGGLGDLACCLMHACLALLLRLRSCAGWVQHHHQGFGARAVGLTCRQGCSACTSRGRVMLRPCN